ncbi:hypothetical protein [Blautia intestinalis]
MQICLTNFIIFFRSALSIP